MSKRCDLLMKPIFLGLALLIFSTLLNAQVYQWNDSGFQYLIAPSAGSGSEGGDKISREDGEGGGEGGSSSFSFVHEVDIKIKKYLSAFFQTDFNWEEQNPKNLITSASVPATFYKNWRVSGTYNRFQAKLEYNEDPLWGKIQYRNQFFESGRTNPNYVHIKSNPNLPFYAPENGAHRPELIQDVYVQQKLDSRIGLFDVGGRARISNYNLAFWDTLGVEHHDNTQRNEYFIDAQGTINTLPYLYLLVNCYAKHDNTDDYYDMTQYGMGASYNRKFSIFDMLDASTIYERMNSNAYSSEKDHYVISQLRYTHRIGTTLTAFLSYINRSVYSKHDKTMLLVSQVVRVQARYTLPNDISGESYVILGGKISPENKTSIAFGEFNYLITHGLYGNLTDKYSPTYVYESPLQLKSKRENEVGFGFNYYFTPWQMIYANDLISTVNGGGASSSQNLISIGMKLVF